MLRRRSLAVLVLMVILTLAPSLALAASVCVPQCCPAMESTAPEGAERAAADCRSAFANRSCCGETLAPVALASPTVSECLSLSLPRPSLEPVFASSLLAPERRADARLALRTSPLRRSVVLLI